MRFKVPRSCTECPYIFNEDGGLNRCEMTGKYIVDAFDKKLQRCVFVGDERYDSIIYEICPPRSELEKR